MQSLLPLARLCTRRATLHVRVAAVSSGYCRFLSSKSPKAPSNPFEIQLNLTEPVSTTGTFSVQDAKQAATLQQAEAEHEISLLHDEMSRIFGEDVAEHDGGASSSIGAAFEDQSNGVTSNGVDKVEREEIPVLVKKDVKAKKKPWKSSQESVENVEVRVNRNKQEVVLVMGPCSFMRGIWTGGNIPRAEFERQVEQHAEDMKLVIKIRDKSEGAALGALMHCFPDQVVVLYWNISLAKSPFVLNAIELIKSRVIVVSPNVVDHGPLPPNVVGVVSGFGENSILVALTAAAKLRSNSQAAPLVQGRKGSDGNKTSSQQGHSKKAKKNNRKDQH